MRCRDVAHSAVIGLIASISAILPVYAQRQQPQPRQLGPKDTQTKGTKLVTFKMCKGADGKYKIGEQPQLPAPFEGRITMGPDGDGYLTLTKPYKATIRIYKTSAECKLNSTGENASGAAGSNSLNLSESGK